MAQLLAGRLVQGLGSGAMNVAIFVCVAQAYSIKQRPKMFTYISTAWVLPAFVGPPASAWLTEQLSWHWVFFAVIPLVLFGGVMAPVCWNDPSPSAWQWRCRVQASAVVGCWATLRCHRGYATCWAAAGLDRAETSGGRPGDASGRSPTANAARILEIPAGTVTGHPNPGSAPWRSFGARPLCR